MSSPSSNSIQFTVRQKFSGPVIYVRKTVTCIGIGVWRWGSWRKAKDAELNLAIKKLMEITTR